MIIAPKSHTHIVMWSWMIWNHLSALLRSKYVITIMKKAKQNNITSFSCKVIPYCMKCLLTIQTMTPDKRVVPINNMQCSALIFHPLSRQNFSNKLSGTQINVAANTARILHKTAIKATFGINSDSVE